MGEINFRFVQQPTPHTCVHACLSMVTGVPVQNLIIRFGDRGLPFECEAIVLIENGIFPDTRFYSAPVFPCGFYIASAPSLNMPGALHRVVVEVTPNDDFVVHDPNSGREDVTAYPPGAMHCDAPSLYMFNAIGLDPYILKHLEPHQGRGDGDVG